MMKERRTTGADGRLSGAQVRLRPVTALDLALLLRWDEDPEIEALMGRRFGQIEPADWLRQHLVGRGGVAWMIEERATERPVGELELANLNRRARTAELRICLGEAESRGHGYGREALGLALRFAFVTLNLRSVHLRVYASNGRAVHLYDRMGFRKLGIAPPSDRRGDSGPILLMELTQERWHRLQEQAG